MDHAMRPGETGAGHMSYQPHHHGHHPNVPSSNSASAHYHQQQQQNHYFLDSESPVSSATLDGPVDAGMWSPPNGHHVAPTTTTTNHFGGGVVERKDPPRKRGRPTANPCWTYFDRLTEQEVRCRHCHKVVKSACVTNMMTHMRRHHRDLHRQLLDQIDYNRRVKAAAAAQSHGFPMAVPPPPPFMQQNMRQMHRPNFPSFQGGNNVSRPSEGQNMMANDRWSPFEMATGSGGSNAGGWPPSHDDPLLHPAAPTATKSSTKRRRRKTEHPVWQLFERTPEGDAKCALCAVVVRSPCSSNFMRHLMRHHSIEHQRVYGQWLQQRRSQLRANLHFREKERPSFVRREPRVPSPNAEAMLRHYWPQNNHQLHG